MIVYILGQGINLETDVNYLTSGSSFTLTCTIQTKGITIALSSPTNTNCAFCDPPPYGGSFGSTCQPYKDNYDIQCTENGASSTMEFEVYAASDNEFGEWQCAQAGGPSDTIDIKRLGNYSNIEYDIILR